MRTSLGIPKRPPRIEWARADDLEVHVRRKGDMPGVDVCSWIVLSSVQVCYAGITSVGIALCEMQLGEGPYFGAYIVEEHNGPPFGQIRVMWVQWPEI